PPTSTLFPYTTLFRSPPHFCTRKEFPWAATWMAACSSPLSIRNFCEPTNPPWWLRTITESSRKDSHFLPAWIKIFWKICGHSDRSEEHTSELQSQSNL